MTSAEPSGPSEGHQDPYDDALCAALATEHAVIYGYGIVSARCSPEVNPLVSSALNEHRRRRDQTIDMLAARKVSAPVAAAGYQLPMAVNNETDAGRLAVRMEKDTQVAWRAVIEQGPDPQDREFGVTALTESSVLAARWSRVIGTWPITTAFPGSD
ncbi:ferritin-like domain-containing protein [Mycobacterium shimoidei]|uniref:DUF4439 domain-containing protein n=1 Tax=Mycobacterium shimoidei TaxID=29313 RepID=A0A1E3SX59_MYCSH|nr:ferritin-like domain-containing protein [Mycobacterium shimoidei]MCV7261336.1 ferritin-like domain-containing protein [Mycobacterium shimoidei]ODR06754.1 hypothetical protein BHQ16_21620 [Mycobacterium shimoidei]ORW83166.1 hypothetical protein AWC26_03085 [Mycobacterium shimoidei]SRX95848.1 hypothetical protein MSP7336_04121 [Mycobacterium shimoidei]